MPKVLINAQTAASTVEYLLSSQHDIPAGVIAGGLSGDSIPIKIHDGNNFVALNENGAAVVLDDTHNVYTLTTPGRYQFPKGVTTGTVTLSISTAKNP